MASLLDVTEFTNNALREPFIDLTVARDRLWNAGSGVPIPIMLGTVSDEHTTKSLNGLYELGPLHATTNSATLRVPGIWPPLRS